jgi:hypothetical protein
MTLIEDCDPKYLVFVQYSEYESSGFFFVSRKKAEEKYEEARKNYAPILCKIIK